MQQGESPVPLCTPQSLHSWRQADVSTGAENKKSSGAVSEIITIKSSQYLHFFGACFRYRMHHILPEQFILCFKVPISINSMIIQQHNYFHAFNNGRQKRV